MWESRVRLGWKIPVAALFMAAFGATNASANVARAVRLLTVLERPGVQLVLTQTAEGRAIGEFFTGRVAARAEDRALLADRLSADEAEPFSKELAGKLLTMDRRFAEWQASAPANRTVTELDRLGGISVMDRIYLSSMSSSYLAVTRRTFFTGEASMQTIQFVDRMGATSASYSVNVMQFMDWQAAAAEAPALLH